MSNQKYFFTEEMNTEIKIVYGKYIGRNKWAIIKNKPTTLLSEKFKIPRDAISKQAVKLGVRLGGVFERKWEARELEILNTNCFKETKIIQKRLKASGYNRSEQAINVKKSRYRLTHNYDGMTGYELAECLGVCGNTIISFIRKGYLNADKRGKDEKYYYIKNEHIKDFMTNFTSEIDFTIIDKYWLVDILTDGARKTSSYVTYD